MRTGAEPRSRPGPTFHETVAVYRGLLPWIALVWVAGALLPGPDGNHLIVNLGASPFYGAAAARALGLHPGWTTPALAVDRAFTHMTTFLPLVALFGLAAAVGSTLGAMAAHPLGLPDDRILSFPIAALAALPILWSYWPATLVAYLVPENAGIRLRNRRAWRGPRFTDVRRLTRAVTRPRGAVLLIVLFYLWLAILLTTAHPAAPAPAALAAQVASYLGFLPLLVALAATEILSAIRRLPPPPDPRSRSPESR